MSEYVSVLGAGGAIGGHLVQRLLDDGYEVLAIDVKSKADWWQANPHATIRGNHDLRDEMVAEYATSSDHVFNLAADMGGMGYISAHRVNCLHTVDITSNVTKYAYVNGVKSLTFASSACVYPDYKQQVELVSLKEEDAWPADPEPAYGLEKLYGEEFCKWYKEEYGLSVRVPRFHNVYGPHGSFIGGREKAPAAICRKVIEAKLSGVHEINIWGDGQQTRSFMYVDDCIEGLIRLWKSDFQEPINLGSSELVTINQLVDIAEEIGGIKLKRTYNLDAPQGVRGRNSDNTLIKEVLDWEPSIPLKVGLEQTYAWIYDQVSI